MKKFFVVFVVLIVLAGCVTETLTPTATVTLKATPTLTVPSVTSTIPPIITPSPPPTPTVTPTPAFPSSLESFREEVKNNCAPLPVESGVYSEDIPVGKKIGLARDYLFSQIGEGSVRYDIHEYPYNKARWYCRGIVISLNPNEHVRLSKWGRWLNPVTVAYWSENGIVRYDYFPDPALLLTPTPTKGSNYFPPSYNDFLIDSSDECVLLEHISEELKSRGITEESSEVKKGNAIFELLVRDIEEYVGWELVSSSGLIEEERWFCVSVIGTNVTVTESELIESWNNWEFPVVMGYYSKNGLVVYEYEPTTMPAP